MNCPLPASFRDHGRGKHHSMTSSLTTSSRKLFVILNPVSGAGSADAVRKALGDHFSCEEGACQIHETTGTENLANLARSAIERGAEVVVAAGGDGTVSAVANGVVGSKTHLGILPLGTANVLARDLGIPIDLNAACALLAGEFGTAAVDAMKVNDHYYFTQVGVGIDAMMIRDTTREHKKRFGRVAYLWTATRSLIGFQPRRFLITIDGREIHTHALQVIVANSGTLGQKPLTWGPDIQIDDGIVDVCVVRARTALDFARLAWNVLRGQHRNDPKLRYEQAKTSVKIVTKKPLPAQADGEFIGETPLDVAVVPSSVRVVVPRR